MDTSESWVTAVELPVEQATTATDSTAEPTMMSIIDDKVSPVLEELPLPSWAHGRMVELESQVNTLTTQVTQMLQLLSHPQQRNGDSNSVPPSDHQTAPRSADVTTINLSNSYTLQSQPTTDDVEHAPAHHSSGLEYRSFTPDYEQQLRRLIVCPSRTQSFDYTLTHSQNATTNNNNNNNSDYLTNAVGQSLTLESDVDIHKPITMTHRVLSSNSLSQKISSTRVSSSNSLTDTLHDFIMGDFHVDSEHKASMAISKVPFSNNNNNMDDRVVTPVGGFTTPSSAVLPKHYPGFTPILADISQAALFSSPAATESIEETNVVQNKPETTDVPEESSNPFTFRGKLSRQRSYSFSHISSTLPHLSSFFVVPKTSIEPFHHTTPTISNNSTKPHTTGMTCEGTHPVVGVVHTNSPTNIQDNHKSHQPPILHTPTPRIISFFQSLNLDSQQHDGSGTELVDLHMEEFIRVPVYLEHLLLFGVLVCVDSFLHVILVLPLQFLWSCLCLVCTILSPNKGIGMFRFYPRHLYQLIRVGVIFFVYYLCLRPISIGKLYHWIRGQAMLKIYVIMAMVEVFDRLMCSLGQDSLDSLYWNTTRRPYHRRMIISSVVFFLYAVLHTLVLFVHFATLNVAMNSSDHALLTLLISNNFNEIKSTVFKKYNKQQLFSVTASDICERFKHFLFLGLILLLNCAQGGMNSSTIYQYVTMSTIILASEMLCDWIKHAFVTKFNVIECTVYSDYALILAGDVTGVGHEGLSMDHTHAVVKRLGFAQIPLVCVMLRYLKEATRYLMDMTKGDGDVNPVYPHALYRIMYYFRLSPTIRVVSALVLYMLFLGVKTLLGYVVTKMAQNIIYNPPGLAPSKRIQATGVDEKITKL